VFSAALRSFAILALIIQAWSRTAKIAMIAENAKDEMQCFSTQSLRSLALCGNAFAFFTWLSSALFGFLRASVSPWFDFRFYLQFALHWWYL
jgi:hypothetical protein